MQTEPIHPAVRVGHVHLRVADLDRAISFYRDALGFGVSADAHPLGLGMVLLAAGDYHHHVGLNTFDSEGAGPPPGGHTGLASPRTETARDRSREPTPPVSAVRELLTVPRPAS